MKIKLLIPKIILQSLGTNDNRRGDKIRPITIGTIYETFKILNIS